MSITKPPPPTPPKKRGLGCLGCGCLIVALIIILILGLVAVGSYLSYTKALALTAPTSVSIPAFPNTDDFYIGVKQKLSDFDHDVQNHQAATIRLSSDEINAVLARDPYFDKHKIHIFVTFVNDVASVQGSVPCDELAHLLFTGRFVNFDSAFGLKLNTDTKNLDLTLYHLQIGGQSAPNSSLPFWQVYFTPLLNLELQANPETKNLLDQAKSIRIENGNLVIETH
jgi:hypothetical protein